MAKQFPAFDADHIAFIADQHIFFVGTAAPDGHVNLSPKGRDSLRVMGRTASSGATSQAAATKRQAISGWPIASP